MTEFSKSFLLTAKGKSISISVTDKDLSFEETIPRDELKKALKLNIGKSMEIHYGINPVKCGILYREK
ncbi:MAG: hypothetical protein II223_02265 [Treponema sp.]|nr:hypothetical protein [Treponema sp.]